MENQNYMNKIWDKIGICASGLCLVHCLATPVILLLFPALKLGADEHSIFHEVIAAIVVTSILFVIYPHCRKHGHKDIIVLGVLGVASILTSLFLHDLNIITSQIFTIIGSIMLITAHIKNMKIRHGKCEGDNNCTSH